MISHAMRMTKNVIHHLNPEQVPVMVAEQPLYAIAKQVQWCWPEPRRGQTSNNDRRLTYRNAFVEVIS